MLVRHMTLPPSYNHTCPQRWNFRKWAFTFVTSSHIALAAVVCDHCINIWGTLVLPRVISLIPNRVTSLRMISLLALVCGRVGAVMAVVTILFFFQLRNMEHMVYLGRSRELKFVCYLTHFDNHWEGTIISCWQWRIACKVGVSEKQNHPPEIVHQIFSCLQTLSSFLVLCGENSLTNPTWDLFVVYNPQHQQQKWEPH